MPEFPGGDMALLQYFRSNVRYPEEALLKDIQGVVFVSFVIGVDGSVRNVGILKGIGGGCDEEALRVIQNMPKWQPGITEGGEPVRIDFKAPISFKLEGKRKKAKKTP